MKAVLLALGLTFACMLPIVAKIPVQTGFDHQRVRDFRGGGGAVGTESKGKHRDQLLLPTQGLCITEISRLPALCHDRSAMKVKIGLGLGLGFVFIIQPRNPCFWRESVSGFSCTLEIVGNILVATWEIVYCQNSGVCKLCSGEYCRFLIRRYVIVDKPLTD